MAIPTDQKGITIARQINGSYITFFERALAPPTQAGVLTDGDGVASVIEQFAERGRGARSPRLLAVDGVQTLVDEEPQAGQQTRPRRCLSAGQARSQEDTHRNAPVKFSQFQIQTCTMRDEIAI